MATSKGVEELTQVLFVCSDTGGRIWREAQFESRCRATTHNCVPSSSSSLLLDVLSGALSEPGGAV